jgi:hypothetical protein
MVRTWQLLVCSVLLLGAAVGANTVHGYTEDVAFSVTGDPFWTVTISAPGSYLFWATDDEDPDGLRQGGQRVD